MRRTVLPMARTPAHVTDTIDYAIVMEGEITAIMDEGETLMKQGDILVQRGTSQNRLSLPPASISSTLVLASPLSRLARTQPPEPAPIMM